MEALVEKLCNRFSGVTDIRRWEYISYYLSQLAFTKKRMKKFIESFKTYEHVLSEDSVMNHFRNIINKFTKPELKLCIEFEKKLNKLNLEKKEQEATTRNAQIHQHQTSSMEGFGVTRKAGGASLESDITEETNGEVIDSSVEWMIERVNDVSKSIPCELKEDSNASSELT
ncbi:condensin complex subunit 1 [Pyrus ussuriensis x Pyrus communis]|uniref:Condensin complex subunit 1 n=1 Tax=Pyrus ussuriensis x Pyrus communis TaxID=2448454 RepID=A0A5N5HTE7_9ROSA|nr:condensin complex subunit 1 [Pyrus ussuriensis x Pyrus communis]